MKQFLITLVMCCAAMPAIANDWYYADDIGDDTACPVCRCTTQSRDNYAGFRIYKNEHSSYDYHVNGGLHAGYRDDDFGFGTTVGNNLAPYLRVEYETLYMNAKYSKHSTDFEYDIWANMLNAYLLHDFDNVVAPYVGAGVGLTGIWGEINGDLDNAFDLSYQVMVGVLFRLNSRIDLDLGFKYVDFGRVDHKNGSSRIDATQLYLGAAYKFGI